MKPITVLCLLFSVLSGVFLNGEAQNASRVAVELEPAQSDEELYICDFEKDLCGMSITKSSQTQFSWIRFQGSTPSEDTGPDFDHTTLKSSGYYVYTEATEHYPGEVTKLTIPGGAIKSNSTEKWTDACLTFWYHMYGQHIGTLNVTMGEDDILWSAIGNRTYEWIQQNVTLKNILVVGSGHPVQSVSFVGVRGGQEIGQPFGDIAIDDVIVYAGRCGQDDPTTVEPTTTMTTTTTTMRTTTTSKATTTSTTTATTTTMKTTTAAATTTTVATTTPVQTTTMTTTTVAATTTTTAPPTTTRVTSTQLPTTAAEATTTSEQPATTEIVATTEQQTTENFVTTAGQQFTTEFLSTGKIITTEEIMSSEISTTDIPSSKTMTTDSTPTIKDVASTTEPSSVTQEATTAEDMQSTGVSTATTSSMTSQMSGTSSRLSPDSLLTFSTPTSQEQVGTSNGENKIWGLSDRDFIILIAFLCAAILLLLILVIVLACLLCVTRRKYNVERTANMYPSSSSIDGVSAIEAQPAGKRYSKQGYVSPYD